MLSDTEFKGEGPAPSGSRPPLCMVDTTLCTINVIEFSCDRAVVLQKMMTLLYIAISGEYHNEGSASEGLKGPRRCEGWAEPEGSEETQKTLGEPRRSLEA